MIEEIGLGLAAAALALPVVIEVAKRPRIQIEPHVWTPQSAVPWTFATVYVRVAPLPRVARSMLVRQSAAGATVTIEFRQNGQLVLPEIAGRWSARREPVEPEIVTGPSGQPTVRWKFLPEQVPNSRTLDLAPGRWEEVAVAIQRQDGTASAFAAESYAHSDWRHQGWDLPRGVYDVTVRVASSGVSRARDFMLDNLAADFNRFRLTPTS